MIRLHEHYYRKMTILVNIEYWIILSNCKQPYVLASFPSGYTTRYCWNENSTCV